ncbi:MAG: hypothetical protein RLZZ24_875 [Pseudomonadota bacterium]
MASASDSLTETAPLEAGQADAFASVKLTPPLVLTISLLFIIASDGDIDAAESSQIQSVIGQNEPLVRFASDYVRAVPIHVFLSRAKQGLSREDRWCILTNVCDAMLADGVVHDIERKTFDLLMTALGISKKEFAATQASLRLKNDFSVMGTFNPNTTQSSMTPHLALAASVLYMMSADGAIDKHEIGRIETLIAQFNGLQKLAVAYVRETPRERFIQEAAHALNETQKWFILLNVYDTMTADGVVAIAEDKIFQALLLAFQIEPKAFTQHADVLERKNIKPFDLRKVDVGQLFQSVLGQGEISHAQSSANQAGSVGEAVSRTIDDNVVHAEQTIGSSQNVVQIQANALDDIHLQKIDATQAATHRETLNSDAASTNRQSVNEGPSNAHRETIDSEAAAINRQTLLGNDSITHRETLTSDAATINRQALGDSSLATNRAAVPYAAIQDTRATLDDTTTGLNRQSVGSVEIRISNLTHEIDALYDQLIEFENKNKSWLSIGKQFQFELKDNVLDIPEDLIAPNRAKMPDAPNTPNAQPISNDTGSVNRQRLAPATSLGSDATTDTNPSPRSSNGLRLDAPSDASVRLPTASDSARQIQVNGGNTSEQNETETAAPTVAASVTNDVLGTDAVFGTDDVAASESRATDSSRTQARKKKRGGLGLAHEGRASAYPIPLYRLSVKEWFVAITLATCVPGLGVIKAQTSREARGVLVKIQPAPEAHPTSTIEFLGP